MFNRLHKLHGGRCGRGGLEKGMKEHVEMALKHVGATDAQKDRLKQTLEPLHGGFPDMEAQIKAVHEKLYAAVEAGDREQLSQIKAEVLGMVEKGLDMHAQAAGAVFEELEPAQRKKLAELMKEHVG